MARGSGRSNPLHKRACMDEWSKEDRLHYDLCRLDREVEEAEKSTEALRAKRQKEEALEQGGAFAPTEAFSEDE